MKRFFLTILICLLPLFLSAQDFCGAPALPQPAEIRSFKLSNRANTNLNAFYTFRLYFHVLRSSNGTGGVSDTVVQSAYNVLSNDYNINGIFFLWDGNIDYIDNSSVYLYPSTNIFSVNNHSNGIDVYIYPLGAQGSDAGYANGFGNGTELFIAKEYNGVSYATTHIISHEMGHILNLYHTHHGTVNENGGDINQCPEFVNGSNADVCGDYVEDTPADPNIGNNIVNNCIWAYQGSVFDSNNDAYNPDTHLIMSYTSPSCMEYFSPLQVVRMKNSIAGLQILRNALLSITGPDDVFDTGVYGISLPSSFSANWSLSGANTSNFTLQSDSLNNQCTITRKQNVEFSGSAVLTLTAQIMHNGITVATITKDICAPYISGASNPCSTGTYYVEGYSSGQTVSWSLSGSGYAVDPNLMPTNPEGNNYLALYRTVSSQTYTNCTITATVSSGGNVIGILHKTVSSSADFTGTWFQSSSFFPPYTPDATPEVLECGLHTVTAGKRVVLQSDNFIGATLTGNMTFSHSNNTVSFFAFSGGNYTIDGYKTGTCEAYKFRFLVKANLDPLELSVNSIGSEYVFSLQKQQGEEMNYATEEDTNFVEKWQLSVMQYETGQTVYNRNVDGKSVSVNTLGWKPGLYIAIAKVNDDTIAKKLAIVE